ncbi:MAG: DUF4956 domain-containing protein [Gemmataceae bacterium]|nr:DUF4956 domain-containing protein [Gemmataceae bacterium]
MPEWLKGAGEAIVGVDLTPDELLHHAGVLVLRLAVAFGLGCVVAVVYRRTHRGDTPPAALIPTLVMLAVLIALVTQVIGTNVARAFSLVGALSIVRFRTTVEDTRDTAFVIFAVVVGMGAGAGLLVEACLGTAVGSIAAVLVRPVPPTVGPASGGEWLLTVRLGIGQGQEAVATILDRALVECRVSAVSTARQGVAIEVTYRGRLRPGADPGALVAELNRVDGVQQVDLRRG